MHALVRARTPHRMRCDVVRWYGIEPLVLEMMIGSE
jgi:hypothetical protein